MRRSYYFTLTVICCMILSFGTMAQDLGFTYQAVAVDRSKSEGFGLDSQGEILANTNINLRFSIREGSEDGPIVYQESHVAQTDIFGIFRLVVGRGQTTLGTALTTLDWGKEPYFLEVDLDMGSGYEFLGVEELMGSPYSLNQASNQNLDLTGDQLSISGGNTITLQDVDPANEIQDISTDGTPGNLEISNGSFIFLNVDDADADSNNEIQDILTDGTAGNISINGGATLTLNVDDADADISNEIQTLSIAGNDLSLSGGGGTITLPSMTEDTTDELQTLSRTDLDVILSDGGGTVSVKDDDSDPLNEIQDLQLTGDILTITNNGSPTSVDLSPYNTAVFATAGGITSNSPGALDTDDFVFGSTSLDDVVGTEDDSRMFFDKSKGAFRTGVAEGGQWDAVNLGAQSIGFGKNVIASGPYSFAGGDSAIASGAMSTAIGYQSRAINSGAFAIGSSSIAFGTGSFAMGYSSHAVGAHSVALGNSNESRGTSSLATGYDTRAEGNYSISTGNQSIAAGNSSFAGGISSLASGENSFTFGWNNLAEGEGSVSLGSQTHARGPWSTTLGNYTTSYGYASLAAGYQTAARSYAEVALGSWNREVSPYDDLDVDLRDQLLVLGNGIGPLDRSDAFVVYKSGDATLYGTLTEVSDQRLKDEITALENSNEKLIQLRGVNFKWNDIKPHDTESLQTGLIAQEVAEIFPELVDEDSEGYKSVNYIGLIPHLVEALKDMNRENRQLQKEIDELHQKSESIFRELDRITAELKHSENN